MVLDRMIYHPALLGISPNRPGYIAQWLWIYQPMPRESQRSPEW
jgi:hypothetical protein